MLNSFNFQCYVTPLKKKKKQLHFQELYTPRGKGCFQILKHRIVPGERKLFCESPQYWKWNTWLWLFWNIIALFTLFSGVISWESNLINSSLLHQTDFMLSASKIYKSGLAYQTSLLTMWQRSERQKISLLCLQNIVMFWRKT